MLDRMLRHLDSSCPAEGTGLRRIRLLVLLLLIVGVLAWSALTSLHAQPGPGQAQSKKTPEKKATLPEPSRTTNDRPHFQFTIDPRTPVKELLPAAPKVKTNTAPLFGDDLTRVPEVQFEAPEQAANADAVKHIAHQIAKINHLNDKKADGFIAALRSERSDLTGLPFAMGDACRSTGERNKQFTLAARTIRDALEPGGKEGTEPPSPRMFWTQYRASCAEQDMQTETPNAQRELRTPARVAALMHILATRTEMHAELVKHLSSLSHIEATRALARMAIFSGDKDIRKAAIEGLKVRRERDYTEILLNGLRYPWPTVARRAAESIAALERIDLLPQLIDLLEQPDPRAPVTREIQGKRVSVVRELVRVNHHRSCLLCHAPGNTGKVSADTVRAEVSVPGEPLTHFWERCRKKSGAAIRPEIFVRIDVVYLRQDFSVSQAVADANPWPEMQRFDFLVRERTLTDEEATAYREKLAPRASGQFSPYHRAALVALRDLTGRDTAPTPQAWRRLLQTKTP